jgi:hypothetical protein
MASDSNLSQYDYIYTVAVKPGIKRDGTVFETEEFTDGVWCRFQRERARKMGGYRQLFSSFSGIYRGLIAVPYEGINYIFAGNAFELDVFTTGLSFGTGIGPFPVEILPGTTFAKIKMLTSSSSFTVSGDVTSVFTPGSMVIFSQTSPSNYTIQTSVYSSPDTTITLTQPYSGTPTTVWLNNVPTFSPDPASGPFVNDWQFDALFNPTTTQLSLLAHPGKNLTNIDNGVPSQVLVGNVAPSTGNSWTFTGLADTAGQQPTYKPISVSGGVCVLYPFIFVYGTTGFLANNNVSSIYTEQTLYDWNGPLANQVNVSASKIVKGMTMRGGTNSPSGLFWATDSLVRVSFLSGNTTAPYWSYDIVSSQISIISSNAVVEMDGTYYWMGIDRFYLYNGGVKVLDNDKNVNYLFDNINYEQRQKVWATKIPRYNEIWFFYPRGTSTECNDAIIYNTKDQIWYDAGQAVGSQRSCGYTTELFPSPIWADWNLNVQYTPPNLTIATPTGLNPPTNNQFYLTGDQTGKFSPGDYISFSTTPSDTVYLITSSVNIFNTTIGTPGVTLVTCSSVFLISVGVGQPTYVASGGYTLWQHESGYNMVNNMGEFAIYSSITTSDLSWVGGSPSGDSLQGINRRMHIRRFEPNFLQSGKMSMTILGRKFADDDVDSQISGPYYFDDMTGKIDLRVEYRLLRIKFESNDLGGNFEMGRNIITAEYGDERP